MAGKMEQSYSYQMMVFHGDESHGAKDQKIIE